MNIRNLNTTTPKNEYSMPIVDILVNAATGHKILSFMDGHVGYNQYFIAKDDASKMAFRCQ